ncbi:MULTISPECIES: antibiotic biosynthesis monooxygenase family protein [Xanthobacter]|uniref:antibiotic biosynthesis monooxygenase family protein n=1 Tax=Xanthobacter TaxID=279 RepID=UPI00372BE2A6
MAEIKVTDPLAFEAAIARTRHHFLEAAGCLEFALYRVVETPDVYRLAVTWRTIEDHTVTFRASDGFKRWREEVLPFFAAPPSVTHVAAVHLA